ncbi:VOC family protein [Rugosimonospora acidiphila]|uniref:VOC family protein n=1 Tax=Rugosimonospora acidiphila TaxID=556531 RepID=A0ABP9RM19_9ACTN
MASGATSAPEVGKVRYGGVGFDCADPAELGRFYGTALGLPVAASTDDFVLLGREGGTYLAFVRIDDYRPPTWPEGAVPKQAHLELGVDDLDEGQAYLVGLGATAAPWQPEPDRWRVLLDPAGHPFCISTRA